MLCNGTVRFTLKCMTTTNLNQGFPSINFAFKLWWGGVTQNMYLKNLFTFKWLPMFLPRREDSKLLPLSVPHAMKGLLRKRHFRLPQHSDSDWSHLVTPEVLTTNQTLFRCKFLDTIPWNIKLKTQRFFSLRQNVPQNCTMFHYIILYIFFSFLFTIK